MSQLYVVGVGSGDPSQLTAAARRAIDSADVVFAAERHAALAGRAEHARPRRPPDSRRSCDSSGPSS